MPTMQDVEQSLMKQDGSLQQMLQVLQAWVKRQMGTEKFYILASEVLQIPAVIGSILDGQNIQQGLNATFVITDLSAVSDGDFKFNFRLSGGSEYYFQTRVKKSAIFLGTLPFKLSRPIIVEQGSGITVDFTNQQAGANNVQVIFIGYKVYSSSDKKDLSTK